MTSYDFDWPWIFCTFKPTADFEMFRQLFDSEFETPRPKEDPEDAILNLGLHILQIEGHEVIRVGLLHIQADKLWFRELY